MLSHDQLMNCERQLSLSWWSCSDQRADATKGVKKLFNEFLTCEHILTPII